MRIIKYVVFLFFGIVSCVQSFAIEYPPTKQEIIPKQLSYLLSNISVKQAEQFAGRRFTIKEKLTLKIVQWKLKKDLKPHREKTEKDEGKTAMILGIIGLAALFLPFVSIASIPLAILAWVIGNKALKENPNDKRAKTGVILGKITLGLILLFTLIIIGIIGLGLFRLR